jgi:hypothetical protein
LIHSPDFAKLLRQVAPPNCSAKPLRQAKGANQRAPSCPPHRTPERNRPADESKLIDPFARLRQTTPPSHSAKSLRQAKGANQRAPIRERQAVRLIAPQGETARLMNRSSLIHSPDSAKLLRQTAPPSRTAKSLRHAKGANQRAPSCPPHRTPGRNRPAVESELIDPSA